MANTNLNWDEMLEADQSLLDLMTKYPEIETGVPEYLEGELRKLRREQRVKTQIPPDHPDFDWSRDVDLWGKKGRQIKPMSELEKRFKQAIRTDEPKFQRFNIGGRGGTEETKAEMAKMDTRTGKEKFKSGIEEEGGPKGKYTHKAVIKPEEVKITLKDRLANLWNDADRRDAILGGISDAMLETRVGADAYGSRLDSAQKNVRQNLKLAEATDMARAQAALDMAKTQAETNKLLNPAQFMSDTQREASDIASMEHTFGSPEWKEKYAAELRRIAYKDMMTGPVDAIIAINEYMMRAPMDETQKQVYTEIIEQLMTNIRSASGGEAPATSRSQSTIVGGTDPGL